MPHTIRTDRLLLRPPLARDARAAAQVVNDWAVVKETESWGYPVDEARTRWRFAQYAARPQTEDAFFVMMAADGLVGTIGMHARMGRTFGLGYMIGRDHWGQGYVSEAARAACRFCFAVMGAERIEADVFRDNPASARVLIKTGFRSAGDPGPGWSATRGGYYPRHAFALTRTDLR